MREIPVKYRRPKLTHSQESDWFSMVHFPCLSLPVFLSFIRVLFLNRIISVRAQKTIVLFLFVVINVVVVTLLILAGHIIISLSSCGQQVFVWGSSRLIFEFLWCWWLGVQCLFRAKLNCSWGCVVLRLCWGFYNIYFLDLINLI